MSGIVGIVNLDGGPVDRDLLQRMTGFMTFRGPDTQAICIEGNVGFGQTMLRTTYEAETETQPLTLDGNVWLTADARIDGRAELIAELEAKLRRSVRVAAHQSGSERSPNDAELILLAYEAWGEECVKHLIGDFAFAIWDARQRRLFCARDHFGVRLFYYAVVGNTFVFSNTLECIRRHPAVSDNLNEVAIGDYLLFALNQDLASTVFADIQRLPQASCLSLSKDKRTTRTFWQPPTDACVRLAQPEDYVEQFKQLFSRAISDRLRTDKISVSMSGGLDSTSIAAVANDLLPGAAEPALQACCVVYDRLIPDEERKYSALAAAAIQIPIVHIAADDFRLFQERVPHELEQPEPFLMNATSAQFNESLDTMAKFSRVALSGYDGDAFMSEPAGAHFQHLARELRIQTLFNDMAWYVRAQRQLPPIGFRTRLRRMAGTYPPNGLCPEWIEESFWKRLRLNERWEEFNSEPATSHPTRPYAFRVLSSTSWAPLFEGYDAGTNRLALEMRHPLVDVRLVEFLLGIPVVPWCVHKEILKQAMADKLPKEIINRPKTTLAGDPLRSLIRETDVRFVEDFKATPQLGEFVDLGKSRRVRGQEDSDILWTNLRPFALNHWLTYSFPLREVRSKNHCGKENRNPSAESTAPREETVPITATDHLRSY
jgi:asparagine synthase (glutamine-hydrolysing)